MNRIRRTPTWLAVVCALAFGLAACAPKTLPPAPAPATPKFPDFVFPAIPEGVAGPGITTQFQSGWNYLQLGDTHSADRTFTAVLKALPALYPAEAALGYSALARKDAQNAVQHFERAITANAGYAPALAGKGDALLALGKTEPALEAFQAALAADPSLTALKGRVDVLRFTGVQQEIATARRAAEAGHIDDARKAYQSAIAASPDSAFLYRELATVEKRAGDLAAALDHAQRAVTLDPGDARALTLVGEIHEANHEWQKAADAYSAANALEPGDVLAARADAMRERVAFDTMPEEYRTIETSPTVNRAQLAAVVAVRLESLLRRARGANAVVMTDIRDSWAAPWIQSVTRAGVMDVFPNHTFQPAAEVRRADLAAVVSHILALIGADNPKAAARWRDPRPKFADVAPTHLSYPAAARAVSSGVMSPLEGDSFQLTRPVTGTEVLAAVTRLEALAKGSS